MQLETCRVSSLCCWHSVATTVATVAVDAAAAVAVVVAPFRRGVGVDDDMSYL
jgi:hypothetical protein